MPGTRTSPLATAAATSRIVSLQLIDASGDTWSESMPLAIGATAANIEAWAAAYAAASNASLYGITDTMLRSGDADPDNAVAEFRATVSEGINGSYKNLTTLDTFLSRLVAPIAATMQGNQDIPLVSSTEYAALVAAILTLRTGYGLQTAQFTGRRERRNNPKIKI
jgi:hypothetical protein